MDFYVRYRQGYYTCRVGNRRFRVRDPLRVFALFEQFECDAFVMDDRTARKLHLF